MPNFTWNIQLIHFNPDQIKENGEIDLEGALREFRAFPWAAQIQEGQAMTGATMPTVSFVSSEGSKLGVWATDLEGFEVYYANSSHALNKRIPTDLTREESWEDVEVFIAHFFQGKLEVHPELIPAHREKSTPKEVVYDIRDARKWSALIAPVLYYIIAVWFFGVFLWKGVELGRTCLLLALILGPVLWLFWSYYDRNRSARLSIFPDSGEIEYKDKMIRRRLSSTDIESVIWAQPPVMHYDRFYRFWDAHRFGYLKLQLKDGTVIWITTLLAPLEVVVEALQIECERRDPIFPLLK